MKNPLLLSLTSHVLLLTIIITFTTTTTCLAIIIPQQFREAPKFYNSPNCPSISDHDATTTTTNNNFNNDDDNNTTKSGKFVCSAAAVHVAMTLDSAYLRGSMAAILSILQHTSCPQNVFFHFVASASAAAYGGAGGGAAVYGGGGGGGGGAVYGGGESALGGALAASFPYLNFRIYSFRDSAVAGLISTSIRSALDCPLNYARSYLADLLPPCVRRVVYLDSDLVLVDDIARLAATPLGGGAVLAAPEYCNANFTSYFTAAFWSNPSLSLTFANRRACYFNTGVMVIDLERWRRGGYTARIEEWMELQKKMRIYELGSLPPFLLVFAGNIAPVDHKWNQHGLGGDNFRGLCRNLHPGPVSLLHWSGKGKPWARLDASRPCPLDALWAPYDLLKPPFSFDS